MLTSNQQRAMRRHPQLAKIISGEERGQPTTLRIPIPVCINLGERLTKEEAKQHNLTLLQLGVKCNNCSGRRHEFHCRRYQFTNVGKCRECPDFTAPQ